MPRREVEYILDQYGLLPPQDLAAGARAGPTGASGDVPRTPGDVPRRPHRTPRGPGPVPTGPILIGPVPKRGGYYGKSNICIGNTLAYIHSLLPSTRRELDGSARFSGDVPRTPKVPPDPQSSQLQPSWLQVYVLLAPTWISAFNTVDDLHCIQHTKSRPRDCNGDTSDHWQFWLAAYAALHRPSCEGKP